MLGPLTSSQLHMLQTCPFSHRSCSLLASIEPGWESWSHRRAFSVRLLGHRAQTMVGFEGTHTWEVPSRSAEVLRVGEHTSMAQVHVGWAWGPSSQFP